MNTGQVNEILNKEFTLKNNASDDIQTIYLTDVMEYDVYDNVEQFIQDHSYLLKETDSLDDILTNSIKYNDFFGYLQSNINTIKFKDQNEELLFARAKENEDADYHFILLKNFENKKSHFLNSVIKEFEANENYQLF